MIPPLGLGTPSQMAHGGDPTAVRTARPSIALQPVRPDTGLPDGGTIRFVEDEILDLVRCPDGVTMVTTSHRHYLVTPTPEKSVTCSKLSSQVERPSTTRSTPRLLATAPIALTGGEAWNRPKSGAQRTSSLRAHGDTKCDIEFPSLVINLILNRGLF